MFRKKEDKKKTRIIGYGNHEVSEEKEKTPEGFEIGDEIDRMDVETEGLYYIPAYGIIKIEDVFDTSYGLGTRRMAKFSIVSSTCSYRDGTVTSAYIDHHFAAGGHRIYNVSPASQGKRT